MAPKKMPDVNSQQLFAFFKLNITGAMLDNAEADKIMFDYNYDAKHPSKRDQKPLKKHAALIHAHLTLHPHGMFTKVEVEKALSKLQDDTSRKFDL